MARRRTALLAASLAALAAALAGCSSRTNVAATGNSPTLYTHVYITAQAVWFNSSASAAKAIRLNNGCSLVNQLSPGRSPRVRDRDAGRDDEGG